MKFYLDTDYPVAKWSMDYIYPLGARQDCSINLDFNKKVYELYLGKTVSILDLGCAGGGMVHTFIMDGHIAVGLEGSDYDKKYKKFAWGMIPDNLFTCDCSRPFILHTGDGKPYQFDVITAWEFLEHIYTHDLPLLFMNINNHLKPNGLFLGSTTNTDPATKGVHHHVTRHGLDWWTNEFEEHYLTRDKHMEEHFKDSWVRSVNNNNFVCRGDLM